MNETILYGVLVYPTELDEYLDSIMEEPDSSIGEFHLGIKTKEEYLTYHYTYGDEDDFILLEEILDRVRFPYNYYPNNLGNNFVINRLKKYGADYGKYYSYATFLEHKLFNKYPSLDQMLLMENNWDNQIKLCLEHRVVRMLEGE